MNAMEQEPRERTQGKRILSLKNGAKFLGVSYRGLWEQVASGELPSFRFGRKILVDVDELLAAMRSKNGNGEKQ